jgi:hypothetical protein
VDTKSDKQVLLLCRIIFRRQGRWQATRNADIAARIADYEHDEICLCYRSPLAHGLALWLAAPAGIFKTDRTSSLKDVTINA